MMKRFVSILLVLCLLFAVAMPAAFAEADAKVAKVKDLRATTVTSEGQIRLAWKKIKAADGYEVWRMPPTDTEFQLIKTVEKAKAGMKDQVVGIGPYTYKVRAFYGVPGTESVVYSEFSDELKAKFVAAPTGLKLTAGAQQVTIHFVEPLTGCRGYHVYMRSEKETKFERVENPSGTKVIIQKLETGTRYFFKVRGWWKVGNKTCYTPFTKIKNVVVK